MYPEYFFSIFNLKLRQETYPIDITLFFMDNATKELHNFLIKTDVINNK